MASVKRKCADADLKLVSSETPHLNVLVSEKGTAAEEADTKPMATLDFPTQIPLTLNTFAAQAGSFIDTSQNWPMCMLEVPRSKVGRIGISYALVGSLGAVCGILLMQDLLTPQGVLAQNPLAIVAYAVMLILACHVQFNCGSTDLHSATIENLRENGELDPADEQELVRIEKQERRIRSCLGLKSFGILSLILVAALVISSPISGRVSNYDSVHFLPIVTITWFWLLGVQQEPTRSAIFGFIGACVAITAAALISGGVHLADCFSYVSTAILVGLVIDRGKSENLGWPPIVALIICRLFFCLFALIIAHLETHGWSEKIFTANVYMPIIITAGWSIGLLIANIIVNDSEHVDREGRPIIPNVCTDSQFCHVTQKVLADEVFIKAEELAKKPGNQFITEEHYKQAISLYPYEYRYYFRLAQLYNRLGRYKEAQILLQVTVRVCPQAADAWQSLAALLYNHKQYAQAKEASLTALEYVPTSGEEYRLMTLCSEDSEKRMRSGTLLRFHRA